MSRTPAERWTLYTATAMALSLVVCTALWALDPRLLDNGEPVWLKPIRFSLAFGVHLLTMAWLARLGRGQEEPLQRVFATGLWLQIAAAIVEWACIALQAARGVHSHFNYATFLDHAIFTIMGWGTAVLLGGMLMCAWGVWQSRADSLARHLVLGGMALAVLGALIGVLMVMPTAEQRALLGQGERLTWIGGTTVGDPSGIELPFFHWDAVVGDWRAVHFVGLHGLQALPVLAWLALRASPALRVRARFWARCGAWAYAVLFCAVATSTAQGRSAVAISEPAWFLLAVPGVAFVSCLFAILRIGGLKHVG